MLRFDVIHIESIISFVWIDSATAAFLLEMPSLRHSWQHLQQEEWLHGEFGPGVEDWAGTPQAKTQMDILKLFGKLIRTTV